MENWALYMFFFTPFLSAVFLVEFIYINFSKKEKYVFVATSIISSLCLFLYWISGEGPYRKYYVYKILTLSFVLFLLTYIISVSTFKIEKRLAIKKSFLFEWIFSSILLIAFDLLFMLFNTFVGATPD
jgi:hypothetical protein